MRSHCVRALVIAAAGLWLAGCNTTNKLSGVFGGQTSTADASATLPPPVETTGSISASAYAGAPASNARPHGPELGDDLLLGRQAYRANDFGLAERYFRRAADMHPRDAEAWLGLAAAYDRLHRFELADRAYTQAIGILGATPEIMNNQGYSYMLRGEYKRARTILLAAQRREPGNKYVANNLRLLASAARKGTTIE